MRTHLAAALLALTLPAACTDASDGDQRGGPAPAEPVAWTEVALPSPPGRAGRIAVRDAAFCDGRWYVVGGVFMPGDSRPAAWQSSDGTRFTPMRIRALGYWAKRATLSSVACRDGEVAMVGARSGGAHGNPRVTTFFRRGDGVMVDVKAGMELYGGPHAVAVFDISAGPDGWLISGGRYSGASVWVSPDAHEFTLVDDDPALSKDDELDPLAIGQVHDGERWTVVGSASRDGRAPRVPMAWVSSDGFTWARQDVPETDGFDSLEQVVRYDGGLLAAGLRDDGFGTWRRDGDTWSLGDGFGELDPDLRASPCVCGLAVAGEDVLAAVSDGTTYQLWRLSPGDTWRPVATPTRPTTAGEHTLEVDAGDGVVLLLADDAERGRVWRANWAG